MHEVRYANHAIGNPTLEYPDYVHIERPGGVLEVEIIQKMAALTSHMDALHNALISRMDNLDRRIAALDILESKLVPLTWQQRLWNWVKRLFGK